MLAVENARKEVGATEAGAPIAGDLDAPPAEQRIAISQQRATALGIARELVRLRVRLATGRQGFIGTAAPGDGDNNWWIAKLYAFAPKGTARVIYTPTSIRQQMTMPRVSPDGRAVAFIAGIMSDFGSIGGDVYTIPPDGGKALNVTPGIRASAISLAWGCNGTLRAQLLVGDQDRIVDLGTGAAANVTPRVLWSGPDH